MRVGDRVAGVGLVNDGGVTRFFINADRFAIIDPDDADPEDGVVPFIVVDGEVYIRSAVIQDASIESVKAARAFLTNLTAVHGVLDFARINKGNIFDLTVENVIQSDNYQKGLAGWRITRQGEAEFATLEANVFNVDWFVVDTVAVFGQSFVTYTLSGKDRLGADLDLRNYDYMLAHVVNNNIPRGIIIPVFVSSTSFARAHLQAEQDTSDTDPVFLEASVLGPLSVRMRTTPGARSWKNANNDYQLVRLTGIRSPQGRGSTPIIPPGGGPVDPILPVTCLLYTSPSPRDS